MMDTVVFHLQFTCIHVNLRLAMPWGDSIGKHVNKNATQHEKGQHISESYRQMYNTYATIVKFENDEASYGCHQTRNKHDSSRTGISAEKKRK